MSVSTVLHSVLDEPVAVLDGIEEEKVITGDADPLEANADMALNNAIYRIMVKNFISEDLEASELLRCTLKEKC